MIIVRECLECQQKFETQEKYVRRGHGKFCSLKCCNVFRAKNRKKPEPNVQCAYCDSRFYMNSSKQKNSKSGLFFCCRSHKDKAQKIGGIKEIMPPHYGTSTAIGFSDYRERALKAYPNQCDICGWDKYIDVLIVHHRDRNRSNNNIENLQILCPTHHDEYHYLTKSGRFSLRFNYKV